MNKDEEDTKEDPGNPSRMYFAYSDMAKVTSQTEATTNNKLSFKR